MHLKIFLLFFQILVFRHLVFSQANFQWADGVRCALYDLAVDANNNIYACGSANSICDFDPGPGTYTANVSGPCLLKLDADGNFLSVRLFTCTSLGGALSLVLDSNNNIYLACYLYHGSGDFDPGPATYSLASLTSQDIVLVKLDPAGNFIWAKQLVGTYGEPTDLRIDNTGNLLLTGEFFGTTDFDPSVNTYTMNSNRQMPFVASYDTSGSFLWTKCFAGSGIANLAGSSIDNQGNIVLCGSFGGTIDFDPSTAVDSLTSDSSDIFICKLDNTGTLVYAKAYGGPGDQYVSSMALDPNTGDIYLNGYFSGSQDFDPDNSVYFLNSSGAKDIYISKLTSSGSFLWAKKMGGSNYDVGNSISCDLNGNIFTTGYFNSIANFNSPVSSYTFSSHGADDIFFNMIDPQGNVLWTNTLGSSCSDQGTFIMPVGTNTAFVMGAFQCTMNFNFSGGSYSLTTQMPSYGDSFIIKMSYAPNAVSELNADSDGINLFPNPTNSTITVTRQYNFEKLKLSIFKGDGAILEDFTLNTNNDKIDLSKYSRGYYMYMIKTESGAVKTGKIIKD